MKEEEQGSKATNGKSYDYGRYKHKYINNQLKHYDLKTLIKRYCQDGSKNMI